MKKNPEKVWN